MIITATAATCLAMNVYFEGRGESYDGQLLIAEVTMERVYEAGFPDTVCEVVWDKGAFSWTNDGKSDRPKDTEAWLQAQIVANTVLLWGCQLCSGATYYHNRDVYPYWADDMEMVGMYGNHVFYREKGCDE
jgi:spore germination cell wall hydrolase CwlJ-like protein